ncbi:MAG: hypothetical protein COA74_12635 [Gammaproteobacteria bacterium]|nr:MAG: hypothetical protein COA74_12635 [Gammaproteobacteria bacterium]
MLVIKRILASFILLLLMTAELMAAEIRTDHDDLIIFGGKVITLDPKNPTAKAMLVSHGIIKALGTLDDLMIISPAAKKLNLQGKTLMPGFIDSHVHVHQLGTERVKANLVGAETVREMVKRLRSFYPNPTVDQWLFGQGWDEGKWASKGYPDRALLDEAFPNNPIYLQSLHGFSGTKKRPSITH